MIATEKGSKSDKKKLDEFLCNRRLLLQLLKKKYNKETKELVLELDEVYDEFKGENLELMQLRLSVLLSYDIMTIT